MKRTIRRRRIEAKTDYKSRISILESGKTRLVVRKTNRYMIAQFVDSSIAKDKVIFGVTSKSLLENGWPKENIGSLKSLPAAYLTGFKLAKNSKGKIKEAILDIGLNRNIKKSRIYAVLRGVIDAGVNVPHSEDVLPSLEVISKNEKVGKLVEKLKLKL